MGNCLLPDFISPFHWCYTRYVFGVFHWDPCFHHSKLFSVITFILQDIRHLYKLTLYKSTSFAVSLLFKSNKFEEGLILIFILLINAQELALKYMRSMPYYFPHSFIWRQINCSQFLHGKHFSPRLGHDVSPQGSGKHDPGKAIPHATEISKNIISVDILLRQDFFCYVRQFAKWHKD